MATEEGQGSRRGGGGSSGEGKRPGTCRLREGEGGGRRGGEKERKEGEVGEGELCDLNA